jgi:hypothetical protein
VDGLDLLEHAESIVGVAYVALQAYITGSMADLRGAFTDHCPSATDLRRESNPRPGDSARSPVEIIWTGANYFKHHDKWSKDWGQTGKNRDTVVELKLLEVDQETEFPCVALLKRLQGSSLGLIDLATTVSSWRERWLSQLRSRMTGGQ